MGWGVVGASLFRTVQSGRISPSYLFEGVDAHDLHEAALVFAASLLASEADDPEGVRRRVLDRSHPDLHEQTKDKATVISVAALTALLTQAHQTPFEGRWQVFLIEPAEAMEPEGIARYLKALEEPPTGTVFVLVSTRPDRLPDTVLSRVRRVRIPPQDRQHVAKRLVEEGIAQRDADELARWSGGSLACARRLGALEAGELARRMVSAATTQTAIATTVDAARRAIEKQATARVDEGRGHDRRQEIRNLLQDLIRVFAVEARERAADRASDILPHVSSEVAIRKLEELGRLSAAVSQNVTPAVVLFELVRLAFA
jgi:DNA polymerase-3 subunit delta'